jgi:alkylhydroperoxidase/carboxymuconolactone decarboxylase family protein YurZ
MSNATSAKGRKAGVLAMALGLGMAAALGHATQDTQKPQGMTSAQAASETLSDRQQAIVPIAAFAAAGDISRLGTALNQGLDAGLTVSDAREVLVQLYAYAGLVLPGSPWVTPKTWGGSLPLFRGRTTAWHSPWSAWPRPLLERPPKPRGGSVVHRKRPQPMTGTPGVWCTGGAGRTPRCRGYPWKTRKTHLI